jgi:hypothetical protein
LVRHKSGGGWQLFDLDRDAAIDAKAMDGELIALLVDGRALMRDPASGRLDLVDPETGIIWPLRFENGRRAISQHIRNAGGFGLGGSPTRDARERRVFETEQRFAVLDKDRLIRTAKARGRYAALIACAEGDICYALEGDQAVVELNFGTDKRREIYRVK